MGSRPQLLRPGLLSALTLALFCFLTAPEPASAAARLDVTYTEVDGTPVRVIVGPDGHVWINNIYCCEFGHPGGPIRRLTDDGEQVFGLGDTYGIAAGPDRNLWFTDNHENQIGFMALTPGYPVTRFPLPTQPNGDGLLPYDIVTGPDNNLWVTLSLSGEVAQVTTAGQITRFPLRPEARQPFPTEIAAGSNDSLWIGGEQGKNGMLARMSTDGEVRVYNFAQEFPVIEDVIEGPSDRIWFSYLDGVGYLEASGKPTLFSLPKFFDRYDPSLTGASTGLTVGPDGNLWIAITGAAGTKSTNAMMRLTPGGRYTYFPLPFKPFINRGFELVTRPATKTIYFTQPEDGVVGRFRPPSGRCRVPRLVGAPAGRVAKRLKRANCSLGALDGPHGAHAEVVAQHPKAGRKLAALSHVYLKARRRH